MKNFEKLTTSPEALADAVAKLIVHNVRSTVESNYGVTGNDVMWARYLKEQRRAVQTFLQKEAEL
ncbi:MAG: hypothetical protein ACK5JF_05290 [Oscillospiraceae bacterium]